MESSYRLHVILPRGSNGDHIHWHVVLGDDRLKEGRIGRIDLIIVSAERLIDEKEARERKTRVPGAAEFNSDNTN